MKFKKNLKYAVIPTASILTTLSFIPLITGLNDNVLYTHNHHKMVDNQVQDDTEGNETESQGTSVLPGKDVIYRKDLTDTPQFEMDYAIYTVNPSRDFQGLNYLKQYFKNNWTKIFKNLDSWDEAKNKIEIVNTDTIEIKVTYQGKATDGTPAELVSIFKLIFDEPKIDNLILRIRGVLDGFKNGWPNKWSETIKNQFYSNLRFRISEAIRTHRDSFPTAIYDAANATNEEYIPIFFDVDKFNFNVDSINILSNAIQLVPREYYRRPGEPENLDVRPIYISTPFEVLKPTKKSIVEEYGWIIIILPITVAIFIILLLIALFFTRKREKQLSREDSWGFY